LELYSGFHFDLISVISVSFCFEPHTRSYDVMPIFKMVATESKIYFRLRFL